MLERLKSRWNIQSNFQLLIIFIVFGITGSASVALGKPLLEFLQLQPENFQEVPLGTLWYYMLKILLIFPLYQVVLLVVGAAFFQFKFFWEFEKKMLTKLFSRKR